MANEVQRNGDVRAILALTPQEALNGARCALKLSRGRQIVVAVPSGTHDGQEIRLHGQGRPSQNGSRGTLILTVSLTTANQAVPLSHPHESLDKSSEFGQKSLLSASAAPSLIYPSKEQASTSSPYLSQRQSPISVDTTFPTLAAPVRHAPKPQNSAPSPRKRRPSTFRAILLIICVLAVVGGSAFLLYTTVLQPGQFLAHVPSAAAAKATGTTRANVRSTANAEATAHNLNKATATAKALAFAHATATATSQQALFTQLTSARPALNDPLHQQDGNHWEEDSKAGGGNCTFTDGAYHASISQMGFFASCYDLSNNFSNFVFQVQMTVLKGDRGGIIFRSSNANSNYYLFRASQDGSYDLFLYVDTNGSNAESLAQGSSPAIHRGLNQPNRIAVIARGSNLSFFINQHYVTGVNDTTYKSGAIGVFADDQFNPTEVAFNNAEVWSL